MPCFPAWHPSVFFYADILNEILIYPNILAWAVKGISLFGLLRFEELVSFPKLYRLCRQLAEFISFLREVLQARHVCLEFCGEKTLLKGEPRELLCSVFCFVFLGELGCDHATMHRLLSSNNRRVKDEYFRNCSPISY